MSTTWLLLIAAVMSAIAIGVFLGMVKFLEWAINKVPRDKQRYVWLLIFFGLVTMIIYVALTEGGTNV